MIYSDIACWRNVARNDALVARVKFRSEVNFETNFGDIDRPVRKLKIHIGEYQNANEIAVNVFVL